MSFFFQKRHQTLIVFLVSFCISFALFGNGISGEFVLDDTVVIEKRSDLKDPNNFWNLFVSPYHQNAPYTGLFRPLTMASYALNYLFLGNDPDGFHVINIIFHAINSALVVLCIQILTKQTYVAYATGILFLTHPLHTEAVTSIVGRAELLAFFWDISALLLSLRGSYWLSAICFFLALLSKESAVALLPLFVYVFRWHAQQAWSLVLRTMLPFLLVSLPYLGLRFIALGEFLFRSDAVTFVENPLGFVSFGERVATAFKILFLYISKIFWPVPLSADYSYHSISVVPSPYFSWQASLGLLVVLGLLYLAWKQRQTPYGLGAVIFLIPWLLISNLILPIGTSMGERLMYLPSLGFLILVGTILQRLFVHPSFYAAVIISIAAVFSFLTIDRNRAWLTNQALLESVIAVHPQSVIARTGLAALSIMKEDLVSAKNHLAMAETVYADYSPLQNLMGVVATKEHNFLEAEKRYLRALELNPRSVHARTNLQNLYRRMGIEKVLP